MAVPSATTFANLKLSILRYMKLVNDSAADTLAEEAIRSALLRLHTHPFKTLLSTSDITLTSGNHTVSLPADFNMALSLHYLNTSDIRSGRIIFRREEDFDHLNQTGLGDAGDPEMYTVRGGGDNLVEFDKAPGAGTVAVYPKVRLRYFKRIDTLVTSTSTFAISPEVEEFIKWWGRAQLAPIYDAKKYPLAMQEAGRSWADLIKRETVRDEQDWL